MELQYEAFEHADTGYNREIWWVGKRHDLKFMSDSLWECRLMGGLDAL